MHGGGPAKRTTAVEELLNTSLVQLKR